ncbi:NmrA family NAD(P)-binding protein [Lentzea rhizosphaerae]|uniref:NmrA family NAD(P)-binding protein n=1 Tax=Lentzea rhizosphaerae TaxID=2041025 RepID=A0ABV8BYI8_9PSEU
MKTVVVTGATGKQGGAVTRHLVAAGWDVRAVTRNPAASVPGASVVARIQVNDPELRKVFDGRAEPPVDVEGLRALHPGLRSFAAFLSEVRNSTA